MHFYSATPHVIYKGSFRYNLCLETILSNNWCRAFKCKGHTVSGNLSCHLLKKKIYSGSRYSCPLTPFMSFDMRIFVAVFCSECNLSHIQVATERARPRRLPFNSLAAIKKDFEFDKF